MLNQDQERLLFESLAIHQPQLKVYLEGELDKIVTTLVKVNDVEQLRRAQGSAQLVQKLLDRLVSAKDGLRKG